MKEDMKDRYYEPSIEEFHVGFEYEVNYGVTVEGTEDWVSEKLNRAPQVVSLPYMRLENIRVKYLDREDIESLGFEFFGRAITPPVSVVVYRSGFEDDDFLLRQEGLSILVSSQNGEDLFNGTIKNKSELKRILKQVGYESRR